MELYNDGGKYGAVQTHISKKRISSELTVSITL